MKTLFVYCDRVSKGPERVLVLPMSRFPRGMALGKCWMDQLRWGREVVSLLWEPQIKGFCHRTDLGPRGMESTVLPHPSPSLTETKRLLNEVTRLGMQIYV